MSKYSKNITGMYRQWTLRRQHIFVLCLMGMLASTAVNAQKVVRGTVVDADSSPIPGVNVIEVGSTNGVVTDFDGNYSIKVTTDASSLQFSYIGFANQTIPVANNQTINVVLLEKANQLDEVVIIGYQTVKKSDLTGAVAKIKTEKLAEIPANNIEELVQGRVPGLVISDFNDNPGGGVNVRIRGASSFTESTPLIVVDGFPLGQEAGNLSQINPFDIVSVEVLKDASAASIYGSRGANGVILVTTRSGREGKLKVDFSSITTSSEFATDFDFTRDLFSLAILTNEESANRGLPSVYNGRTDLTSGILFPSIAQIAIGDFEAFDYPDFVFREPVNYNYNVRAYGGSEITKYNFGLNLNTQDGIFNNDNLRRVSASLGIDQKFGKRINFSSKINFTRTRRNNNGGLNFLRLPILPIFDEDGIPFQTGPQDFSNPAGTLLGRNDDSTILSLISSSIFNWRITDDLTFKTQFNYSLGSSQREAFFTADFTSNGFEQNNVAQINENTQERVVTDVQLTYNKTIGENHQITALGGFSQEFVDIENLNVEANGFVNTALETRNLGLAENFNVNRFFAPQVLSSFFSRVNYSFKDRYLFTFSGRVDGSSSFGPDNRFAFFPSGAFGWKMQEEPFIKNGLPFIDELKPSFSYGVVGNQSIPPFSAITQLTSAEQIFSEGGFVTTVGPGTTPEGQFAQDPIFTRFFGLGNQSLRWESTEQYNIGLAFAAFKRRLEFQFDYFNKRTTDLIVDNILAPSSGFDQITANGGEVLNTGVELSLNLDVIRNKDFTFALGAIYNQVDNEVISLGDESSRVVVFDGEGNAFNNSTLPGTDRFEFGSLFGETFLNVFSVGNPIASFLGARVAGIVQSRDDAIARGLDPDLPENQPGEFIYEDINGDGQIDPRGEDRAIIGNPNPDFTASLTIDATYKKWELSALLRGTFGTDIVNLNFFRAPSNSTSGVGGRSNIIEQRFTESNPSNTFPRLLSDGLRQAAFSDFWIQDGSFVRLQNLRIGYNLDASKIPFISAAKIYLNGDNLFTFTNYEGIDPEADFDGIDNNRLPRLRRYSLGINISF